MVAVVGFAMIICIVALLLKGKMSPIVVLTVIPAVAALILGHGPVEIADFIKTVPSNITLEQSMEPDTGYGIMGSAGMVNQIIINLCNNAVQAMKEKGGCIMVKGSLIMDGDSMKYAVTVSDNGPGMSPEIQKQIFTPFFTTKKQGEGTGLGLSVVQDLIHEVSGESNVVSVEGKGTRFDILFPVFRIQEEEKRTSDLHTFAQYSVLILDDDEKVGEALGRTLRKHCKKESNRI